MLQNEYFSANFRERYIIAAKHAFSQRNKALGALDGLRARVVAALRLRGARGTDAEVFDSRRFWIDVFAVNHHIAICSQFASEQGERDAVTVRTGLNYSFGTKKYCHQIRKFHGILNFHISFAIFLQFSTNVDLFAHICEIPRMFHQNSKVK